MDGVMDTVASSDTECMPTLLKEAGNTTENEFSRKRLTVVGDGGLKVSRSAASRKSDSTPLKSSFRVCGQPSINGFTRKRSLGNALHARFSRSIGKEDSTGSFFGHIDSLGSTDGNRFSVDATPTTVGGQLSGIVDVAMENAITMPSLDGSSSNATPLSLRKSMTVVIPDDEDFHPRSPGVTVFSETREVPTCGALSPSRGGPAFAAASHMMFNDYDNQLYDIFTAIDTNGNGKIELTELTEFLMRVDQSMSLKRVQDIFRQFDLDCSGDISFEEFEFFVRSTLPRKQLFKEVLDAGEATVETAMVEGLRGLNFLSPEQETEIEKNARIQSPRGVKLQPMSLANFKQVPFHFGFSGFQCSECEVVADNLVDKRAYYSYTEGYTLCTFCARANKESNRQKVRELKLQQRRHFNKNSELNREGTAIVHTKSFMGNTFMPCLINGAHDGLDAAESVWNATQDPLIIP